MNENYTNREIDSHFKEIKETLSRIETQTIKTNGRVSKLEGWRAYVTGALAVSGIIILLIVYIFKTNTETLRAEIRNNKQTQQ